MVRCLMSVTAVLLSLTTLSRLHAHCEVPCGIYGDQRRFEQMMEDHDTIAKAIDQINELCGQMQDSPSPTAVNQTVRWVTTKEDHATSIQHTIAQYFMSQRIKPEDATYHQKLSAAHAVMIAAMKCKQDAAADTATELKTAILAFEKAYAGK